MTNFKRALMMSSLLVAIAPGVSIAQDEEQYDDGDVIIVTGVSRPTTKLESSSSVTAVPPEQI